jgi:hemerythrin
MAIEWSPRLAIGVQTVDAQHQELFQRANQLLAAMEARKSETEVTRLLELLGEDVVCHFGDEERLMHRSAYPDYPAHKTAHGAFVAELAALKAAMARQGASAALAIQLNQKVCGWLLDHVGRTDRALGAFLAKQAQASAARV